MTIHPDEVSFREPSNPVPFIMAVGKKGYVDVHEWLLYLSFNFKDGNLLLVEREEYNEDMVLMRTIYLKPCIVSDGWHYRVTPGFYVVQWLGSPVAMSRQSTRTTITVSMFMQSTKP